MPAFTIETNCKLTNEVLQDVMLRVTEIVSKILEKPTGYVTVQISGDKRILWRGTDAPAAICSLCSIGKIEKDSNTKISELIGTMLEEKMGIQPNRYYINFHDMPRQNVGYNKTVF